MTDQSRNRDIETGRRQHCGHRTESHHHQNQPFVAAAEAGQSAPVQFTEGALLAIEKYAWPGNIRQLFNVIRVAIALLDDGTTMIDESHLPEELFETAPAAPASATGSLEAIGRDAAWRTLESAGGNISAAARQLGISRNTLYRKLGKL